MCRLLTILVLNPVNLTTTLVPRAPDAEPRRRRSSCRHAQTGIGNLTPRLGIAVRGAEAVRAPEDQAELAAVPGADAVEAAERASIGITGGNGPDEWTDKPYQAAAAGDDGEGGEQEHVMRAARSSAGRWPTAQSRFDHT